MLSCFSRELAWLFFGGWEEDCHTDLPWIICQLAGTRARLFGHVPPASWHNAWQLPPEKDSLGTAWVRQVWCCCSSQWPLSTSGVHMSHGLLAPAPSSPLLLQEPLPPYPASGPPLCAHSTSPCYEGLKKLGTSGSLSVADQRHKTPSKAIQ